MSAVLPNSSEFQLLGIKDTMDLMSQPHHAPDIIMIDAVNVESMIAETRHLVVRFPDVPLLVITDHDLEQIAEIADSIGILGCVSRTCDRWNLRAAIRAASTVRKLNQRIARLQELSAGETLLNQIIARSGPMLTVLHLVEKACRNEINVLLEGEEGTGKDLIARAIHFNGTRAAGPYLMLNCVAIPNHLIEHELFGYEGSGFGAEGESKPGIFELAEGGTVFIDEIGELPTTVQARLYRAMQTRQIRRLGSEEDISVNVRIVSSTTRDLRSMCTQGEFREDLYFRLASFPIKIPPLRERVVDIPALAEFFLRKHAENEGRPGLGISREVFHIFRKYSWPGNVRELGYCIQRAVLVAESMEILTSDLPQTILIAVGAAERTGDPSGLTTGQSSPVPTMEQLKARGIRIALEASGGNIKEASRLLDIGRTTIYKLIEKYNIQI
ncbi:MAG: sigma-54 dependent transcriptional regulator [Bacteroidota bacterium]